MAEVEDHTLAYLRRLDSKLDLISDWLRSLEVRFGALESRFSAVEERMAGVEVHLERIERRLALAETPANPPIIQP
jgi:septation ring formation regulator EzrA